MKCPGQDMIYWKENAIYDVDCPKCGAPVEFYKDDTQRKCNNCGNRFVNPKMDFGCASYCQFAEQCLGTLPEEFKGARDNFLKDKVAVEMKRFYQADFKKIRLATTTANFAENIGKEEGGNLPVILCTAYLLEIDRSNAMEILQKVGANEEITAEILSLIEQNINIPETPSPELKIIHDAVNLLKIQEKFKDGISDKAKLAKIAQNDLFTNKAKVIAEKIYN